MSGNTRLIREYRKIWRTYHAIDQNIVLCFTLSPSPVSIDTITVLSGALAIQVLNVMESLKKKRIAYEKKEYGRGIYFLNDLQFADFVQKEVSPEVTQEVMRKITEFYSASLPENDEKTLILAELYRKMEENAEGLGFIRRAAHILLGAGEKERALVYYEHLLKHFAKNRVADDQAENFVDSILGKISLSKHLMPVQEQVSLLTEAEKAAKRFEKWDFMPKIKHALGQALQAAGQHKKAFHYMNDFWKLAERVGNARMLKIATLLTSEFLHWKGRYTEVIRRYEDVIEDLEEFENDKTTLRATARVGLCYVRCGRIARGMGMIDTVRAKANLLNLQQVANFADLMAVLALFDLRRIREAELYLNRLSALPEEIVGHYILWPVKACKAYIFSMNGDHARAFEYMTKAVEHSRFIGWHHHDGAWNFDYLDVLESEGFLYDEWNYDGEISRMLEWDDIYMKGVALRYRAMRNMKKKAPIRIVLSDLKNSEKYLKESGAEIELGHTWTALGNVYLLKGDRKNAQSYLNKAWTFFSTVDKNLFPKDLLVVMPQEQKIEVMIDRIININESLGVIQDRSSFLERVINVTMDFTMATRGAFFTVDADGRPRIVASRNLDPTMLKPEQLALIAEVVSETVREGVELIAPRNKKQNGISDDSLLKAGINCLICMPAKLGEERYGYLYLDNRLEGRPFSVNQLPYVRLLCNQIALGLSNIRIYEEMRERKDRYENEAMFYKQEMGIVSSSENIIGRSQSIRAVINQIQQVAPTDSCVLITGETGVGKELIAKAIHNLSKRKDGAFIAINLSALPQELVASELFGHEKGAYTGAHEKNKGRFELADRGTIFLDEVGDLPLNVQVKLLRVLQEGSFERLGSAKPVKSDFRVIAATNKDLSLEVERGTFRQDLYYRLNVFPVGIPPLRTRKEDIPLIARYFIDIFGKKMGKPIERIPAEELNKLMEYYWPGNVRELKHFVERAVILSDGSTISFSGLHHGPVRQTSGDTLMLSLTEVEREHIEKILNATYWRISGPKGAASILGLKATTLLFRMKKLGIKKPKDAVAVR
ncbi:MAG TPA: sigma 54-interacting transcriptional regulator [Syntrophorhabdaceae bacterium]|nr:sigma 54-interacting transcriptional regulator [Syntrophorhabdaceae bacterium]